MGTYDWVKPQIGVVGYELLVSFAHYNGPSLLNPVAVLPFGIWFYLICTAYKIIDARFVKIGKFNKYLRGDVQFAYFII